MPSEAFKRPKYLDLLLPDVADTVRAMARQRACDAEELAQELITGGELPANAWKSPDHRTPEQAA